MKRKSTLLLTISMLFLLSCNDAVQVEDSVKIDNIQINIEGLLADGITLGKLNDMDGLSKSFSMIKEESDEMKKTNSEIQSIVLLISRSENNVILDGFYTLSSDNKIIDFKYKNADIQARSLEPIPPAGCPDGYSDLGTCSNFGDTQECIAGLISAHLTESLAGPGDCANVQVSIGTLSSRVCGSTC